MDTLLHTRDKGTVKTVGIRKQMGSEEGEDGEIDRQGVGHCFLGCTRYHLHRLLGKRTNDNCSVLHIFVVIAPNEPRNQEKTFSFEKEKDPLPPRQCTAAHLRSFDDQNYGIKIRNITTSSVFTGFGPRVSCFYFQTWKNGSTDNGTRQTRRSSPKQLFFYLFLRTYWTTLISYMDELMYNLVTRFDWFMALKL